MATITFPDGKDLMFGIETSLSDNEFYEKYGMTKYTMRKCREASARNAAAWTNYYSRNC